jgi:hypothetical protein
MDQVRMAAAVAAALGEAEVRPLAGIVDPMRRVWGDAARQPVGEVGAVDALWYFRLRPLGSVDDERLVRDERPFDGLLGAVDVDALAVLTRCRRGFE